MYLLTFAIIKKKKLPIVLLTSAIFVLFGWIFNDFFLNFILFNFIFYLSKCQIYLIITTQKSK